MLNLEQVIDVSIMVSWTHWAERPHPNNFPADRMLAKFSEVDWLVANNLYVDNVTSDSLRWISRHVNENVRKNGFQCSEAGVLKSLRRLEKRGLVLKFGEKYIFDKERFSSLLRHSTYAIPIIDGILHVISPEATMRNRLLAEFSKKEEMPNFHEFLDV